MHSDTHAVSESASSAFYNDTSMHMPMHMHSLSGECPEISPAKRTMSAATDASCSSDSTPSSVFRSDAMSVHVEGGQGMNATCGEDTKRSPEREFHHPKAAVLHSLPATPHTATQRGSYSNYKHPWQQESASAVDVADAAAAGPCCEGFQESVQFEGSDGESQTESSLSSQVEDITGGGLHATITCLSLLAAAPRSNKGQWLQGLVRFFLNGVHQFGGSNFWAYHRETPARLPIIVKMQPKPLRKAYSCTLLPCKLPT